MQPRPHGGGSHFFSRPILNSSRTVPADHYILRSRLRKSDHVRWVENVSLLRDSKSRAARDHLQAVELMRPFVPPFGAVPDLCSAKPEGTVSCWNGESRRREEQSLKRVDATSFHRIMWMAEALNMADRELQ